MLIQQLAPFINVNKNHTCQAFCNLLCAPIFVILMLHTSGLWSRLRGDWWDMTVKYEIILRYVTSFNGFLFINAIRFIFKDDIPSQRVKAFFIDLWRLESDILHAIYGNYFYSLVVQAFVIIKLSHEWTLLIFCYYFSPSFENFSRYGWATKIHVMKFFAETPKRVRRSHYEPIRWHDVRRDKRPRRHRQIRRCHCSSSWQFGKIVLWQKVRKNVSLEEMARFQII